MGIPEDMFWSFPVLWECVWVDELVLLLPRLGGMRPGALACQPAPEALRAWFVHSVSPRPPSPACLSAVPGVLMSVMGGRAGCVRGLELPGPQ